MTENKKEVKKRRSQAQINKERNNVLKAIGFTLETWQEKELARWRMLTRAGLSVARQNGKTYVAVAELFEVALQGEDAMYCAHRKELAVDTFEDFCRIAEPLKAEGIVTKINTANGWHTVEFANGAKVYFRTRSSGFATGLTLGLIIFDEAQKMLLSIEAEALPAIRRGKSKRRLYIGTPPTVEDLERYGQNTFMKMKIEKDPALSEYSAYDEYHEGLEYDYALLKRANPGWRLISDFKKDLEEAYETMDHKAFWTMYGAVWTMPDKLEYKDPLFTMKEVESYLTKNGSDDSKFFASVGITPQSEKAYIAFNDGFTTEIVERFEIPEGELYLIADWIRERARSIRQIRIPANARGKALASILKEMNLTAKIKMVDLPALSAQISLFRKQLDEKSLKVFSANDTKTALSSFWLGYEARSGSIFINSGLPADTALVNALVTSVADGKLVERLKKTKDASQAAIDNSNAGRPARRRMSW